MSARDLKIGAIAGAGKWILGAIEAARGPRGSVARREKLYELRAIISAVKARSSVGGGESSAGIDLACRAAEIGIDRLLESEESEDEDRGVD